MDIIQVIYVIILFERGCSGLLQPYDFSTWLVGCIDQTAWIFLFGLSGLQHPIYYCSAQPPQGFCSTVKYWQPLGNPLSLFWEFSDMLAWNVLGVLSHY